MSILPPLQVPPQVLAFVDCRVFLNYSIPNSITDIQMWCLRQGLLTASENESVTNPLKTVTERAKILLDTIGYRVQNNPQVLAPFIQILRTAHRLADVANQLEKSTKVCEIMLELQQTLQPLDLNDIAWKLTNKAVIDDKTYRECTLKTANADKAQFLYSHLAKSGLTRCFLRILELFPSMKSFVETQRESESRLQGSHLSSPATVSGTIEKYTAGIKPDLKVIPQETHSLLEIHKTGSKLQTDVARPEMPTQSLALPNIPPLEVPLQTPPDSMEWEMPVEVSTAKKRKSATEQHKVKGKSKKSSKKASKKAQDDGSQKTLKEKGRVVTETLSHKGRTVAMATSDGYGRQASQQTLTSPETTSDIKEKSHHGASPLAGTTESVALPKSTPKHGSLQFSHEQISEPEQRRAHTEQITRRNQSVVTDDPSLSSSGSYHSTTDVMYGPSSPTSAQPWSREHPSPTTSGTEPQEMRQSFHPSISSTAVVPSFSPSTISFTATADVSIGLHVVCAQYCRIRIRMLYYMNKHTIVTVQCFPQVKKRKGGGGEHPGTPLWGKHCCVSS